MTRPQSYIYFGIAALNIIAVVFHSQVLIYLTKPFLLLSLAFFYFKTTKNSLKTTDRVMIGALLISCIGDFFLMIESTATNFFILGLASFLLAHLCYAFVFSREAKFELVKVLPFILYAGFMLYYLLSHIKQVELKGPVVAYISVITLMGTMAVTRRAKRQSYRLVLLGAILFVVSDSCIGISKFVKPIPNAAVIIMLTYIAAQYFIVKGFLLGRS